MLTKSDLKAIGAVVQTQINESLERELKPIKEDVGGLKENVGGLKKDMKSVKHKLNRIGKDVDYISKKTDEGIVYTRRRVERIEEHLHLESPKN